MKLITQLIFQVTIKNEGPNLWEEMFSVEAENLQEALTIAEEVVNQRFKGYIIKSINRYINCYKSSTKSVIINV